MLYRQVSSCLQIRTGRRRLIAFDSGHGDVCYLAIFRYPGLSQNWISLSYPSANLHVWADLTLQNLIKNWCADKLDRDMPLLYKARNHWKMFTSKLVAAILIRVTQWSGRLRHANTHAAANVCDPTKRIATRSDSPTRQAEIGWGTSRMCRQVFFFFRRM